MRANRAALDLAAFSRSQQLRRDADLGRGPRRHHAARQEAQGRGVGALLSRASDPRISTKHSYKEIEPGHALTPSPYNKHATRASETAQVDRAIEPRIAGAR